VGLSRHLSELVSADAAATASDLPSAGSIRTSQSEALLRLAQALASIDSSDAEWKGLAQMLGRYGGIVGLGSEPCPPDGFRSLCLERAEECANSESLRRRVACAWYSLGKGRYDQQLWVRAVGPLLRSCVLLEDLARENSQPSYTEACKAMQVELRWGVLAAALYECSSPGLAAAAALRAVMSSPATLTGSPSPSLVRRWVKYRVSSCMGDGSDALAAFRETGEPWVGDLLQRVLMPGTETLHEAVGKPLHAGEGSSVAVLWEEMAAYLAHITSLVASVRPWDAAPTDARSAFEACLRGHAACQKTLMEGGTSASDKLYVMIQRTRLCKVVLRIGADEAMVLLHEVLASQLPSSTEGTNEGLLHSCAESIETARSQLSADLSLASEGACDQAVALCYLGALFVELRLPARAREALLEGLERWDAVCTSQDGQKSMARTRCLDLGTIQQCFDIMAGFFINDGAMVQQVRS
jgi:hypothetical protein